MKNLKRALSLALASIMLLGMMVVGASAVEFKDADKIVNVDAVNTMVALGVLKGKDTGDFDPEGIVTRAEMAKIICVMLSGGKEPNLGTSAAAYPDTASHWANSYIAYCANLGIVAGDNHGKFNPDATVTGTEAAKMLLVALGYDSDVFAFTGAAWAINVNTQANKAKLYEDVDANANEGLSRDNAAQMAYNALEAFIMEKTYDKVQSNGQISYNYALSTTTTFLNEYFDGKTFVGTLKGNYNTGAATVKGEIKVNGRLATDDGTTAGQLDRDASFPSTLDIANIGEQVKVIFKDGKGGQAGKPDKNDTIYGIFNTGVTTVYETTKGGLQDAGATNLTNGKIKFGDSTYEVADLAAGDTAIVKNYGAEADVSANTIGAGVAGCTATQFATYINTPANGLRVQSGDTIKFVTDDDGKINGAYVVASKIGTVTAKNAEKVTINNSVGTLKFEDNEIYEDIAKDDVVVATKIYDGDKAVTTVVKAEVMTGEVTGYTKNSADSNSSKVVLDGTTYKVEKAAAMPTAVAGETGVAYFTTAEIGETFDLYMVNGMVGAAVQTSETATNYSLVLEVGGTSATSDMDPLKVTFLAADGTKSTLPVSDKGTVTMAKGDIVTYTTVDGKAKVTICTDADWSADATAGTAAQKVYNKTDKTFANTVTAANAVIFYTKTANTAGLAGAANSDFKAANIRDLKDITIGIANSYTSVTNSDGKVVAAFVTLGSNPSISTADNAFGIVTANKGVVEIDDVYYNQYTIATGDEELTTVNLEANTSTPGTNDTLTVGKIYGFVVANDGKYDNVAAAGALFVDMSNSALSSVTLDGKSYVADVVAVKNYDEGEKLLTYFETMTGPVDGVYTGTDVKTKAVDKDAKIIYVDIDGNKAGDEIGVNAFDSVTGKMNAIIVLDDGVITHIIVETSGEGHIYDT